MNVTVLFTEGPNPRALRTCRTRAEAEQVATELGYQLNGRWPVLGQQALIAPGLMAGVSRRSTAQGNATITLPREVQGPMKAGQTCVAFSLADEVPKFLNASAARREIELAAAEAGQGRISGRFISRADGHFNPVSKVLLQLVPVAR